MRAIVASGFGRPGEVLSLAEEWPRPKLEAGSGQMLVRVLAVSLSPGDWRTLSGACSLIRHPEFPYVPLADVCGVVEAVDEAGEEGEAQRGTDSSAADTAAAARRRAQEREAEDARETRLREREAVRSGRPAAPAPTRFKPGDVVVATWDFMALGGLAEHTICDPAMACLKPPGISPVEAAALANSAGHALLAVEAERVKKGDRVLVIAGAGGVGHFVVQFARAAGAGFIAATGSDAALLTSLGVDRPIDRLKEEWSSIPEFRDEPFDVIFDCGEGVTAWTKAQGGLLKRSGAFRALAADKQWLLAQRWYHMFTILSAELWRAAWTRLLRRWTPRYTKALTGVDADLLRRVMALVEAGVVRPVLDAASPYPFTAAGAIQAFDRLVDFSAHGKLVISVFGEEGAD